MLRGAIISIILLLALFLQACESDGPRKTLDEMATALENNNNAAFMSHIDLAAYSENYLQELTQSDQTLNAIDSLSNFIGLGSLDSLISSFVDVQARVREQLENGVASGELVAECRASTKPGCPWTPQGLKGAAIVEIGPNAAIAKVTGPTHLSVWLVLRKNGAQWQVTGQAILENQARSMASKIQDEAKKNEKPRKGVDI